MVVIPLGTGSFIMGDASDEKRPQEDESPPHRVIVKPFAIGKREVTFGEFLAFAQLTNFQSDAEKSLGRIGQCYGYNGKLWWNWNSGATFRDPGWQQDDELPVVCVSWNDAMAYITWLEKTTGKPYRLPSEAEFEYALRAGSSSRFPWSDDEPDNCKSGNHLDRSASNVFEKFEPYSCDDGFALTSPVGRFDDNAFGLKDMSGNVSEWTEDCWHPNYKNAPPVSTAWKKYGNCDLKVVRGSSWLSGGDSTRSSLRWKLEPILSSSVIGFRVARDLPEYKLPPTVKHEQKTATAELNPEIEPNENMINFPGQVLKHCKDCPEMVVIPSGSFQMGNLSHWEDNAIDEGPEHEIAIAQFAIGKYEVTWIQFFQFHIQTEYRTDAAKSSEGCKSSGDGIEYDNASVVYEYETGGSFLRPGWYQILEMPVVCVSWNDATAYANWLAEITGKPYRLPSEAEIEYVIRAGTTTRYPWGENNSEVCAETNHADQSVAMLPVDVTVSSCSDGHKFTSPNVAFKPNLFGLHDTNGNASEWVEDCWHDSYAGAPPLKSEAWLENGDCGLRVIRGGNWRTEPDFLRSSFRMWGLKSARSNNIGFRVALDIPH